MRDTIAGYVEMLPTWMRRRGQYFRSPSDSPRAAGDTIYGSDPGVDTGRFHTLFVVQSRCRGDTTIPAFWHIES